MRCKARSSVRVSAPAWALESVRVSEPELEPELEPASGPALVLGSVRVLGPGSASRSERPVRCPRHLHMP